MDHLGVGALAGLAVEGGAGTPGGPDSFAFPTGFGVVDAAIHALGEEAEGIGYAQDDELAVDEGDQGIGAVAGDDGRVASEAEGVELIDPIVIVGVGAAGIGHALKLRSGRGIEGPAFGAM